MGGTARARAEVWLQVSCGNVNVYGGGPHSLGERVHGGICELVCRQLDDNLVAPLAISVAAWLLG